MNNSEAANKNFYDRVANIYEKADGRRGPALARGIGKVFQNIKDHLELQTMLGRRNEDLAPTNLLDLCSGTGFAAKIATFYFEEVTAIDISQKMLDQIKQEGIKKVCGSAYKLPFQDEHFDCVCAVAALHHLDLIPMLFKEIARVIRPGGIFYSDHDLSYMFYQKNKRLIDLYRHLRNFPKRFGVSKWEYNLSEVNSEGLMTEVLKNWLSYYFDVDITYHWLGFFNREFSTRNAEKAPFVRIIAKKGFKHEEKRTKNNLAFSSKL